MATTGSGTRRRKRATNRCAAKRTGVVSVTLAPEPKAIRGVRLKTVSAFTMVLALLSLAAFIAGTTSRAPQPNGMQMTQQDAIVTQADGTTGSHAER